MVAVRWYLRFHLSYRDVEELLVERGVEVDHITVFRRVHRFMPLLADAARFVRHSPGDRWFADETYLAQRFEGRLHADGGPGGFADTGTGLCVPDRKPAGQALTASARDFNK